MEEISLDFTSDPAALYPSAAPAPADCPVPGPGAPDAVTATAAKEASLSGPLRRLAERLAKLDLAQLPRVSPVAAKLASMDMGNIAHERAFCALLQQEPVVVARLVGLSNSVAYGVRGRTFNTLDQAVARIGLEPAARMAFGILCGKAVNQTLSPGWREFLWLHALTVAQAATTIAAKVQPGQRANAQFAGLIYDIGVMTIEGLVPGTLDLMVQTAQARNSTLGEMENVMLGEARDAVTTALLRLWSVPEEIAIAVAERNPVALEPNSLAAILHVADALARSQAVIAAIYGDDEPPFPLETIGAATISARVLALCPAVSGTVESLMTSVGRAVAAQRDAARAFTV